MDKLTATRTLKFSLLTLAAIAAAFIALPRILPMTPILAHIPSSVAVYDNQQHLLRLTLASDEQYRLLLPLNRVSPEFSESVSLYEDRWFRWHPGFNPWSLARAAFSTATGQRRMGGSTITMQVARRLYRLDTRTVPGKLGQILRAIQLELLYTKDDILDAYVNLSPYGGNVEGVAAASLVYFGKRADQLTLVEALTLAVIPQNPVRRAPPKFETTYSNSNSKMKQGDEARTTKTAQTTRQGASDDINAAPPMKWSWNEARDRLFELWCERHPEARRDAALLHLPPQMRDKSALPFQAPHLVTALLAEHRPEKELVTTLDLRMQRLLERHVRAYVERQKRVGVTNAAALLVDTRDMGVKAAVGSADFFSDAIAGQVNALTAKRSPGSTLKPFIYALAIDQGLIHPLTVLKDGTQSFGAYTPENFDSRFIGPLTATEALNRSRNLPAVALAAGLDKPGLYDFLRAARISQLAPEQHYGLALMLGGSEVTMEELVRMYAMLANGGELKPLRTLAPEKISTEKPAAGDRLISQQAAFLVLDMLGQNPRPDMAASSGIPASLPIHWKTGTSSGFRDAWTVGIFGPYALAVWLGNFDNTPNPALVGIQMAAPLFFELVDSISTVQPGLHTLLTPPPDITRVEVCSASGDLPNTDCPQRAETWFIPGKSPIRVSTLHRKLVIDNATGLIACPPYKPGRTRSEVYEYWPSDMLAIFRQAGLPRRAPPAHSPRCTNASDSGPPPQITSPLRGVTYTLRLSKADEQTLQLQATVDASAHEVYWFAGEQYLGKAPRGQALPWQPANPGHYELRAVDDAGRSDSRDVTVSVAQ